MKYYLFLCSPTQALRRVLRAFSVKTPCDTCGGNGSYERTRARHLEELTSTQISFLFEAQMERVKAENGVDESEKMPDVPNPQQISTPRPGSPPVRGGTHRF